MCFFLHTATPLTPTRHSSKNLGDDSEKRKQQQKLYDDEFKNGNREPMPLDPRKPITQFNYGILQHPDEYNYLAEAEKQKPTIDFASELSYDSSLYGKISQGSARKQPPIKHYDKYKDKSKLIIFCLHTYYNYYYYYITYSALGDWSEWMSSLET